MDPKMLELSLYDGIPHLLAPVVTDVKEAVILLNWAVKEMEERYSLMSDVGASNITSYNEHASKGVDLEEQYAYQMVAEQSDNRDCCSQLQTKPFMVFIIDELSDLMIQAGKETEPAIARLAQMGGPAGLHLIIATVRPSVDVITDLIKSNFPTRLCFQVSSRIDSKTVLDSFGAECLLGMGDGLFYEQGSSNFQRIHAPFVSDKEIWQLVSHLKTIQKAKYNETLLSQLKASESIELTSNENSIEDFHDEFYTLAVDLVIRTRRVSSSMIQRHFKLGYNRAARIVEYMEFMGIVSAPNSVGKRTVLAQSEEPPKT